MKKLITISFMLAVMSSAAQTWYTINPITGFEGLNDISMLEPTNGLAVGQNGVILKFSNNGWTNMESPVNEVLNSVHYLNPNAAWAVGDNGTVLYFNGTVWVQQNSNTTAKLNDVFFLSENKGWAVGNTILHYDGNGWEVEMEELSLNAVYFYDASEGWIVGNHGKTLKHDGNGWTLITGAVNDYFLTDIVMTGPESGWMCGWSFSSALFHEYNGETWQSSGSNVSPGYGLAFPGHNYGWALHNITPPLLSRNRIFSITEGNWNSSLILGWYPVLTALDHIGTDEVVVSTSTGLIYHHQDGMWQISNGFADDHIYGIEFLTPSYGYVAAGRSGLLKYENGNWTTELKLDDFRFEHVIFTEDGTGWAAGNPEPDDGVTEHVRVFSYVDGEWEEDLTHFFMLDEITSFYATDEIHAWLGGFGFLERRTAETWIDDTPGNIYYVRAIYFENPESGWIAARKLPSFKGSIFRYQNGTWTTQYELTGNGEIEDFSFLDDGTGFAVGSDNITGGGLILYYDGTTWTEFNSPTNVQLNIIKMIDNQTGWAGGNSGTLLHYDGSTWELHEQNLTRDIKSISFADNTLGLVGGTEGAFFATQPLLPVGIEQPAARITMQTINIFPNPATSQTRIEYFLKEPGMVHLEVYDLSGRKVLVTASDQKSAGPHLKELNLDSLKKGVYILKVQDADGISQSAKLMVK